MINRKVVQLGVVGIFIGIIMSACAKDDKKNNSASRYVEVNNVCFNTDSDREVSRHLCDEENAERFYIQNNRCYRHSSDEQVDINFCDSILRNSNSHLGYSGGWNNNYQQGSNCTGIMYMPGTSYQVNCSQMNCSGQFLMDYNGRTGYCQ